MPPWLLVSSQQVIALVLAFINARTFASLFDPTAARRQRVGALVALVLGFIVWSAVVLTAAYEAQQQANQVAEQRRETRWVRDRAEWLNAEVRTIVDEASSIRTQLVTNYESDASHATRLRRARSLALFVNAIRDKAIFLLRDELPGTTAAVGYDYGFGKGSTEWDIRGLDGLVQHLIAAMNSMETLVARSTVPRDHAPKTRYRAGVAN